MEEVGCKMVDIPPLDRYIAMDCETVRTRGGQVLARIGMVNHKGEVVLQSYVYVNPKNVVDYITKSKALTLTSGEKPVQSRVIPNSYLITRINSNSSPVHGIEPQDLVSAPLFEHIQPRITALLKDKILVGHAVYNDLAYIHHRHPYEDVRDTSLYYPLREKVGVGREGEYPGLKKLYKVVFGQDIQVTSHDPVEDARAAMRLYISVREEYETSLAKNEDCVAGVPRSYEKVFR